MNESIQLIGQTNIKKKLTLKKNLNIKVKFVKNYSLNKQAKKKYIEINFD